MGRKSLTIISKNLGTSRRAILYNTYTVLRIFVTFFKYKTFLFRDSTTNNCLVPTLLPVATSKKLWVKNMRNIMSSQHHHRQPAYIVMSPTVSQQQSIIMSPTPILLQLFWKGGFFMGEGLVLPIISFTLSINTRSWLSYFCPTYV